MRNPRLFGVLAAASLAAALTACGSSDSGATGTTTSAPSKTEAAAERLAGRYAHYDVVAYDSTGLKNLIVSFGYTDLSVKDGQLIAHESFCHADQVTAQAIETTISDAATSAIKPISTPVDLKVVDGKAQFHRPETPTGIGIHLEDPANDELPTDPNDPRIADDDHDGKPGITVHVDAGPALNGDLYIARRERFAYDVKEQADRSLRGTVTDKSEQLIIGATDERFVSRGEWVQYPDLSKSPIILIPVSKSWDCTKLMAEAPSMFPPQPKVDF